MWEMVCQSPRNFAAEYFFEGKVYCSEAAQNDPAVRIEAESHRKISSWMRKV